MINFKSGIIYASVFATVTCVGSYITYAGLNSYQGKQDYLMSEIVNSQASAIERRLSRSMSSTQILAQEIRQQKGMFDDFEHYADEVMAATGGISNLQLAPGGIITRIHPLAGNEKAIGHNILKDDKRKKEAKKAVKDKKMTLAGPFELIQGGIAVIGRNPIYITDEKGNDNFWGFASALIYLEDLLRVTDLTDLESKGYCYELSRIHPDTGKLEVFARSESKVNVEAIQVIINVPSGKWMLRMVSPTSVQASWYNTGYLISALLALLITLSFRRILIRPEMLNKIVSEQTKELQYLAHNDHLTGLANRIRLHDIVDRVCVEYGRTGLSATLLMIDLDDFKQINDFSGHDIGDEVLKEIGNRLKECVRSTDVVARLGGDEFSILLQHTEAISDINQVATKLINSINQPINIKNLEYQVSASIGVAIIPQDGSDVASACKHADMAMYSAKHSGKNNYCYYNDDLQTKAIHKVEVQSALSKALINDEFELYLQPIINFKTTKVESYEALIRWNHPKKGLLFPDYFIEIAEETSLIFELGYWVINEACQLINKFGIEEIIAVNLSAKQFNDPNLRTNLIEIITKHEVLPTQICIEVTESCLIDDIEKATDTLNYLNKIGFHIALDDFGTGYSSLTLLQYIPKCSLKIDRSFISNLTDKGRERDIVLGLLVMAHKLGMEVVAEGIETIEQYHILRAMKCDYAQGFLFSRPKSVTDLFVKEMIK